MSSATIRAKFTLVGAPVHIICGGPQLTGVSLHLQQTGTFYHIPSSSSQFSYQNELATGAVQNFQPSFRRATIQAPRAPFPSVGPQFRLRGPHRTHFAMLYIYCCPIFSSTLFSCFGGGPLLVGAPVHVHMLNTPKSSTVRLDFSTDLIL